MDSSSILLSPRSVVFWRHIVGIAIILLAQHPARYESGMMFLGLWSGTVVIALGGAGLVAGLGYLFFTTQTKGKAWRIFVVIAWSIAVLQLFGEWFLPTIVNNIASTSPKSSSPKSSIVDLDAPNPDSPKRYWTTEELNALEANTQQSGRNSRDNRNKENGQTCSLDSECSGTLFCIKRKCAPPAWQSAESKPTNNEKKRENGQTCSLDSECSGTLFCIKRKCAPPAWQNSTAQSSP